MKPSSILPFILAALIAVPPALAESTYEREMKQLRDQRDKAVADATKALNARYQQSLDLVYRRALQAKDPTADGIKTELETLGPLRPAAAAPGVAPSPPTLDELRKRMGGTNWKGDDGGSMTFAADKFVTTSWGTRGEWKIVTPRRMTVDWGKGKKEEMVLEPDLKTFARPNGIKWHLKD